MVVYFGWSSKSINEKLKVNQLVPLSVGEGGRTGTGIGPGQKCVLQARELMGL